MQAPPIPRLRGRIHQFSAVAALPLGVALVARAPTPRLKLAVGIYALSLFGLFATSATYHLIRWKTVQGRKRMRAADHSMIFVLIAGTYTAFGFLALRGWWRVGVLAIVWTCAAVGVT